MLHVILWNEAKDNDFIYVTFDKTKTCQHLIHGLLKLCRGVFETKWRQPPLVQIVLSMKINPQEHCFDFVTILEWQLMVAIM
jgi:hypothetical protein